VGGHLKNGRLNVTHRLLCDEASPRCRSFQPGAPRPRSPSSCLFEEARMVSSSSGTVSWDRSLNTDAFSASPSPRHGLVSHPHGSDDGNIFPRAGWRLAEGNGVIPPALILRVVHHLILDERTVLILNGCQEQPLTSRGVLRPRSSVRESACRQHGLPGHDGRAPRPAPHVVRTTRDLALAPNM